MLGKLRDLLLVMFWGAGKAYTRADVRVIYAPGGKQRVVIIKRSDGAYFFKEELFNDKLLDMSWEQGLCGPEGGCRSQREAEAAARQALAWFWTVQE